MLIPRTALFASPERVQPAISPDGQRLAWIAPDGGVPNIWVGAADLSGARVVTAVRGRGIGVVVWAHDNHHVLYMHDAVGDGNHRLHAVDPTSGEDRDLTPFEGVGALTVGGNKHHPDHVLVALGLDDPAAPDVYRVHLPSGRLDKVADNPGVVRFVADADLRVRAGVATTPAGGRRILVRDGQGGDWRTLVDAPPADAAGTTPVGFTTDGRALWVLSSVGANTRRLLRYDLTTGEPTVVAADPDADVTHARLDPDTGEAQWVTVLRERLHHEALEAAVADDLAFLVQARHGDLFVSGRDHADRVWEVSYSPDDGPVTFARYERATRRLTVLFHDRPRLRDHRLAHMQPISMAARDGLRLHGYLTAPPGVAVQRLPTVLLVHGGPWERDRWGYDPQVQWLANRGYLVVQVNFRGSAGYGRTFLDAGDRQWGAAMHDDLLDTVDWAVDQGAADPDRVAVLGSSYGGYAALCAATFTPARFACALAACAPANLLTLLRAAPPHPASQLAMLHRRIGDPDTDADMLWERSPLSRAHELSIPLLLARGADDPRVPPAEAEQLVAVLREGGIDHEHLVFDSEGSRLTKPSNRTRFHAAAEAFLARHLGGRHEP